jgi:RNA polymerase sigma factor (TIGR02999 family)
MNSSAPRPGPLSNAPAEVPQPGGHVIDERPRRTDSLLEDVYGELRRLAAAKLKGERVNHTLQPTALVHEAYMRLAGGTADIGAWQNRGHFFAAAAEAMRRVLIEHARAKGRVKRGGQEGRAQRSLQDVNDLAEADLEEVLRFDEVFQRLEQEDPEAAAVVRLRFYAGLSIDQTAEALGLSSSTVDRRWTFARAWIHRRLDEPREPRAHR